MLQENIFWLDVKKGGEEVEYSERGPSILLEMSALEETAQLDILCERAAGKYSPAWGPIYTLGNVDLEQKSLLLFLKIFYRIFPGFEKKKKKSLKI